MNDMPDLWEERLAAINARLLHLEEQVAELSSQVEGLTTLASSSSPIPTAPDHVATADPAVSLGMREVIGLIHQGKGDKAQRRLYALPESELAEQPAVVAIAAAALCSQRNDYPAALTALKRARQLTNDPRLLKVIQLVEAEVS